MNFYMKEKIFMKNLLNILMRSLNLIFSFMKKLNILMIKSKTYIFQKTFQSYLLSPMKTMEHLLNLKVREII